MNGMRYQYTNCSRKEDKLLPWKTPALVKQQDAPQVEDIICARLIGAGTAEDLKPVL